MMSSWRRLVSTIVLCAIGLAFLFKIEVGRKGYKVEATGEPDSRGLAEMQKQAVPVAADLEQLERELAQLPKGSDPNREKELRSYIEYWRPRLQITLFDRQGPESKSVWRRADEVHLGRDERAMIGDPLASIVDLSTVVGPVDQAPSAPLERARWLFNRLHNGVKIEALTAGGPLTAAEAAAAFREGRMLGCRDGSYLYVGCARSLGLQADIVAVYKAVDGSVTPHGCAGVWIGGRLLLVDLAYHWFGVPHDAFQVLNDAQTAAVFLAHFDDPQRIDLAFKLAPELPFVSFAKLMISLDRGHADDLPAIQSSYAILPADSGYPVISKAMIAENAGRIEEAAAEYRRATALALHSAFPWVGLGNCLARLGDAAGARQAYEMALSYPHSPAEDAEMKTAVLRLTTPVVDKAVGGRISAAK
jgi:tetratricopeptide (TPR) repeat protein